MNDQIHDTAQPDRQRAIAESSYLDLLSADLKRGHENLDAQGRILRLLPEEILARVSLGNNWLQISNLSREQTELAFRCLCAGHWKRRATDDGRLQYDGVVQGVPICIYGAEPPSSCRIETEEIDVLAHKEIRRTLVCK